MSSTNPEQSSDSEVQTYPGNGKLNLAEVIKLRFERGWTLQEIADKFGATKSGVYQLLQRFSAHLPSNDEVLAYRENRATIYDAVGARLVQHMLNPEKLEKASINNLAFASRQIYEMHRLETGQSTQNINSLTALISSSHQTSLKKLGEGSQNKATVKQASVPDPTHDYASDDKAS